MDNPGHYDLATLQVTTALTSAVQSTVQNLDGMSGVTLEAQFQYGSGGTTCSVVAQTSFDGGTTWRDIARFDFTTSSATKQCNLNGLLSKAVTAYAALGSEGVNDGVLGNQLRAVVTSTGTYANTTLALRASVR